jgi:ADP-dependent NAD(P)H-hydrate dehydratase / NAD(P)H-hydrate epimerase
MIPILTPSEMAAVDAAAPEPVEVLIERAGAAVAGEALRMLGGAYGRRIVVLAGKGNNGSDGRAAAVRLHRRGARVDVIDALDAPHRVADADLVIDAAYGTGFHGEYDAPETDAPVLAVDIPSGVDGITGEAAGRVLRADRTVTFAALKPGLLLADGRALAGQVVVADIGLAASSDAALVEAADVAAWLPRLRPEGHKWKAAVLVVAGGPGMTGAAHLVAAAAQRTGAGMVRVGSPGLDDDSARPVEAVGLALPADAWADAVLAEAARFGALVVGPGLGRRSATQESVRALLADGDLPAVIDADALVALGDALVSGRRRRPQSTVLTPHDGEYQRLMGELPGADRLDAARRLAVASGSVALLKGSTTVVAHPDGRARVIAEADARLATAGTGDVLSGIIGALLARGLEAFEAAAAGAWLHGRAALLGAAEGLVAGDLPTLLPQVLADVRPEARALADPSSALTVSWADAQVPTVTANDRRRR